MVRTVQTILFIMALRWGICSTGRICNDFVCALSTLDPEMHPVVAVASRSSETSGAFAALHQIPKSYGSDEELANDPDVDIVYVGSINTEHLRLVKLFLNSNKHILCEKPLGLTLEQVREMVDLAKEKNVFFMEGIWSRFFPSYRKIQEILDSGILGEIKGVSAEFGFPLRTERNCKKELGGGALLDIGIYNIQLAMFVFKEQEPSSVHVAGHLADTGVDDCANITFLYPDKAIATLSYNQTVTLTNEAYIYGSLGRIKIPFPFWSPTSIEVIDYKTGNVETYQYPLPKARNPFNFNNSAGLRYEAEAIRQAIQNDQKEHPFVTHDESIKLAAVMQKIRHSLGYYFDGESDL